MTSPFLDLKQVSCRPRGCETDLISNLALDLSQGDFLVVLGSNGSGKTSLIKAINGLYPLSAGEILLEKQPLHRLSVEKTAQQVVTLTQDPTLSTFSELTVLENCRLAIRHTPGIEEYLGEFHPSLPRRLHTLTGKLSGGERQSLALAMCLLRKPKLLLLDEHTSALDPTAAATLMDKTASHIARHGTTAVMTTHNLEDALRFGNRLIAMRQGEIVFSASGTTKDSLTQQDLLAFYER